MRRKQTFVVTVEMPCKDGCGEIVERLTPGDIRRALSRNLVESADISVSETKERD